MTCPWVDIDFGFKHVGDSHREEHKGNSHEEYKGVKKDGNHNGKMKDQKQPEKSYERGYGKGYEHGYVKGYGDGYKHGYDRGHGKSSGSNKYSEKKRKEREYATKQEREEKVTVGRSNKKEWEAEARATGGNKKSKTCQPLEVPSVFGIIF